MIRPTAPIRGWILLVKVEVLQLLVKALKFTVLLMFLVWQEVKIKLYELHQNGTEDGLSHTSYQKPFIYSAQSVLEGSLQGIPHICHFPVSSTYGTYWKKPKSTTTILYVCKWSPSKGIKLHLCDRLSWCQLCKEYTKLRKLWWESVLAPEWPSQN